MTKAEREALEAQLNSAVSILTLRLRASRATIRITRQTVEGVLK